MPTYYKQSSPDIKKSSSTDEILICHNHTHGIDYQSFSLTEKGELNQLIDHQKVSLKGCITFFKTMAEDKTIDGRLRAAATCALEEDKARLEDFENHKRSTCVIL